jgi:phospholipid/cholesterol/gamma-HCH transport system substrate-binding protein
VDKGGFAEIRKTVQSANGLIATLQTIAEAQSRELTKTQESMRRVANAIDSSRVDSTFRAVGDLTKNVNTLTTDLRGTTAQLNGILAKLDSKQGSAGMLLNDDGMYRDVRSLLQRLDSLTLDFQKNPRKYINLSIF